MLNKTTRFYIEFGIFLLFIISLPSFEAPKNILYGLFLLAWVINRLIDKDWGGSWRLFDSLILLWMVCDVIVNLVSVYHGHGFKGAWDLLRYSSVLWMVSRTRYTPKQYITIAATFAISIFLGLLYAYYGLHVSHQHNMLDLISVGESNHSAVYVALSFSFLLSFLLGFWGEMHWAWKTFAIVLLVFMAYSLLLQMSRAAFGMAIIVYILLAIAWLRKQKALAFLMVGIFLVCTVTACIHPPAVLHKTVGKAKEYGFNKAPRNGIYRVAVIAWEHHPYFGFGSHNYKFITASKVKSWLGIKRYEKENKIHENYFSYAPHAHNLYLNTLAEMGIVGFIPLMLVLIAWLYYCVRFFPRKDDPDLHWAVWASAFSALLISGGVGLVNTTLNHETGLQSLIMLGLALSYFCRKRQFDEEFKLKAS